MCVYIKGWAGEGTGDNCNNMPPIEHKKRKGIFFSLDAERSKYLQFILLNQDSAIQSTLST